jgi:hypothetical protein
MAPIVGIVLVGLVGSPRWRAAGTRAAPVALIAGVVCALLWLSGLRVPAPASISGSVASLIAFGAGFSAGGLLTLLWWTLRARFSGQPAKVPRDGAPPSS